MLSFKVQAFKFPFDRFILFSIHQKLLFIDIAFLLPCLVILLCCQLNKQNSAHMRTTIVTSQFRYIIILSMLICLRQSYAQTWSPGKNGNYSVRGGNAASYFNKNEGYFFIIGGRAEDRFLKTTQRYSELVKIFVL